MSLAALELPRLPPELGLTGYPTQPREMGEPLGGAGLDRRRAPAEGRRGFRGTPENCKTKICLRYGPACPWPPSHAVRGVVSRTRMRAGGRTATATSGPTVPSPTVCHGLPASSAQSSAGDAWASPGARSCAFRSNSGTLPRRRGRAPPAARPRGWRFPSTAGLVSSARTAAAGGQCTLQYSPQGVVQRPGLQSICGCTPFCPVQWPVSCARPCCCEDPTHAHTAHPHLSTGASRCLLCRDGGGSHDAEAPVARRRGQCPG